MQFVEMRDVGRAGINRHQTASAGTALPRTMPPKTIAPSHEFDRNFRAQSCPLFKSTECTFVRSQG
jgi:transposase